MRQTSITIVNKAYEKVLDKLNKQFFTHNKTGLLLFVEYLKYLRDMLILQNCDETVLTSCTTAIAEFDSYNSCDNSTKKQFHWDNFCELLKQNMEDWLTANDSV